MGTVKTLANRKGSRYVLDVATDHAVNLVQYDSHASNAIPQSAPGLGPEEYVSVYSKIGGTLPIKWYRYISRTKERCPGQSRYL